MYVHHGDSIKKLYTFIKKHSQTSPTDYAWPLLKTCISKSFYENTMLDKKYPLCTTSGHEDFNFAYTKNSNQQYSYMRWNTEL